MRDEIRRVLKMLEEGRITAEQAERLIDAIERHHPERKPTSKSSGGSFQSRLEDRIASFVMDIIQMAFDSVAQRMGPQAGQAHDVLSRIAESMEEIRSENLPEDYYVIRILEGDVRVRTSPGSQLSPGTYAQEELVVPPGSKVAVNLVDGDVQIEGDYEELRVWVVDGDIRFRGKFKEMLFNAVDGNVHVLFTGSGLTVEVDTIDGSVKAPGARRENGRLILGDGSAHLGGRIVEGDLHVSLSSGDRIDDYGYTSDEG
ncbi:MAG: hypothetical protein GXO29_04930 [Thermotogae bacterium]|nr:hypothetical protein [Thermotogota bacterium]